MKTVGLQDECPEFFIPANQQRKILKIHCSGYEFFNGIIFLNNNFIEPGLTRDISDFSLIFISNLVTLLFDKNRA
jgi:hypothetical protein